MAPKCPNMEFLKLNFSFQSFRKTEAILLSVMWLKDWLNKVKTSKIITVCYFWPKMGKNVVLISFKFPSSHGGVQFPLRYFYNHYFLLLNVFLMQFLKPIDNATLIWPKFFSQNHTQCSFFSDFQWNMLGDSVNITNLSYNPVILKKNGKTSTNCYF